MPLDMPLGLRKEETFLPSSRVTSSALSNWFEGGWINRHPFGFAWVTHFLPTANQIKLRSFNDPSTFDKKCCTDGRPDSENVHDYMVHYIPQGSKPYCKLSKHCSHSFQPYKETFSVWIQHKKRNFSFPPLTPLKPKLNMSVIMKMSRLESRLCLLSEKRRGNVLYVLLNIHTESKLIHLHFCPLFSSALILHFKSFVAALHLW